MDFGRSSGLHFNQISGKYSFKVFIIASQFVIGFQRRLSVQVDDYQDWDYRVHSDDTG